MLRSAPPRPAASQNGGAARDAGEGSVAAVGGRGGGVCGVLGRKKGDLGHGSGGSGCKRGGFPSGVPLLWRFAVKKWGFGE